MSTHVLLDGSDRRMKYLGENTAFAKLQGIVGANWLVGS